MNCNTCRYELSMCLDGRLPSGRRSVVMQHVDDCAACATFWAELQAAQRLALLLPREKVSEGFRDQLWERIRAGEGTPDAVFREPVPLLAKVRYAMTGAAAAAAVLVCATLLRRDTERPLDASPVATEVRPKPDLRISRPVEVRLEDTPLVSAAQRLTTDVFALETARQLEQRHATAQLALRRLGNGATDGDAAVGQALNSATDFLTFGECLLELRDRQQLSFKEPDVEAELRFAVKMLGRGSLQDRNLATVRNVVGPALQSNRLAHVSATLMTPSQRNPREERDVMIRLSTQRPEVFGKLFFVIGSDEELRDAAFLRGQTFVLDDQCGPSWVAPRSEVEAQEGWLRILGNGARTVDVHVHVQTGK